MTTSNRFMSVLLIVLIIWLAIPLATPAYAQGVPKNAWTVAKFLRALKFRGYSTDFFSGARMMKFYVDIYFKGDPAELEPMWDAGFKSSGEARRVGALWVQGFKGIAWIEKTRSMPLMVLPYVVVEQFFYPCGPIQKCVIN